MLQFLHIADVHLGLRITRYKQEPVKRLTEARFQALENLSRLIDRSNDRFLLVCGDLFDDVTVDPPTARRTLDFFERLPIPVYLIPGNHDPLQPGSVWEREPWSRAEPGNVHLLRKREPVQILEDVVLFPGTVFRKTSYDPPLNWVSGCSAETNPPCYWIGMAHGSVQTTPDSHLSDHPIPLTTPKDLGLDYVALGHWHQCEEFLDEQKSVRMAYPGVLEPFRFNRWENEARTGKRQRETSIGWKPYSNDQDPSKFFDDGNGTALRVRIEHPGGLVTTEKLSTRQLSWQALEVTLKNLQELEQLIERLKSIPQPERTVFRLDIEGSASLAIMKRLEELRGLMQRFAVHEFHDEMLLEPAPFEIEGLVGTGILSRVHDQLLLSSRSELTGDQDRLNRRARALLYEIAARIQESP